MLDCRTLTSHDVDAAMALSRQAGWNQCPADWERLLELSPAGCFAGTVDGTLVATTTVITYGGDASWIGMVLVDEAHRSQGYGGRLFERGLEYALEAGGESVGLDATHLGEPIYEKYGFERVAPVFRWRGALRNGSTRPGTVSPADQSLEAICAFDRAYVGVDRSALLRRLADEPDVCGYVVDGPTGIDGYAFVRPGRTHRQIGPIVTSDPASVTPLLEAVAADFGGCDVIVDAPERRSLRQRLEAAGLEDDRELVRMTHEEATPVLLSDAVGGFVDFAFG